MNILGLHFGHDGGVAVIRDGVVVVVALTERHTRAKHGFSIDAALIEAALADAGVTVAEIDACAITTTQVMPIMTRKGGPLRVKIGAPAASPFPPGVERTIGATPAAMQITPERQAAKTRKVLAMLANGRARDPAIASSIYQGDRGDLDVLYAPEAYPRLGRIVAPRSLAEFGATLLTDVPHLEHANRLLCHVGMTIELDGRAIPAVFVDHHAAHAADAYYQSGLKSGAVLTFDGSTHPLTSSGLYLGTDRMLIPIAIPAMWAGPFYDAVGARVGPGIDAGKLMGLAPYGTPAFFSRAFVGTGHELGFTPNLELVERWLAAALAAAKERGDDVGALGKPEAILEKISTDIAASAHMTFEENVLAMVAAIARMLATSAIAVDGICLAGGCALSCPTNTRVALESGFKRLFVPPSCDDSGLAAGAALWANHNLLGRPMIARDAAFPVSPYVGLKRDTTAAAVHALAAGDLAVERPASAGAAAAADLGQDRVIAWFEGRSEIGPRALGHRSILADPRRMENWRRVNRIKGREQWRPLAPMVLQEDAAQWFADMPLPSPYMLLTGNVRDREALPAVTHVDGTARVQTVTRDCGAIHDVLTAFRRINGGCSVLLNTSFNGPGEPIVETIEHAARFFRASELDALYLDGYRLTKK